MFKKLMCLILVMSMLGCANLSNQDMGTVGGGVIGGLIGSRFGGGEGQILATGAGVLLGAIIGGRIGQYMDKVDRQQVSQSLENTPTGKSRQWRNPDSGAEYTVRPTRTYYTDNGTRACREFTTTAIIGGQTEKVYGTACRTDDGSWKIVDQQKSN